MEDSVDLSQNKYTTTSVYKKCMYACYLQHVLVGNVPLLSFVITGEKLVTWFELRATDAYKIANYLPLAYMHQ